LAFSSKEGFSSGRENIHHFSSKNELSDHGKQHQEPGDMSTLLEEGANTTERLLAPLLHKCSISNRNC